MFVEVAVNLPPVRGTFHYHLPPDLEGRVGPGHLVLVPFGRRRVQGVVTRSLAQADVPETRPVENLVDPEPVLTRPQLQLAHWMAERTCSPLIDCLTLMLPPGLGQQADSLYALQDAHARGDSLSQQRVIDLLARRGALRGRQIGRSLSRLDWRRAAEALVRRGLVRRESILDPPSAHARHVHTARLAVSSEAARAAFDDLGDPARPAAARRRSILEALIKEDQPLQVGWLYAETRSTLADLKFLQHRGLVALEEAEVWRDPLAEVDFVPTQAPRLTRDQAAAWKDIQAALRSLPAAQKRPFLLHGVTGSGKTEIYLRAVEEALSRQCAAIVLVPEIALTPQTTRRFLARFPGKVGLMHSQLSAGERYDTWRRCRAGLLPVIVGPRSALFAPLAKVGLIVLDEEHDDSYKEQSLSPRYHARQAALAYAEMLGAVCLLGSATPDVETMFRADQGELIRLELPQRILGHRQRLSQQATRLGVASHYRPTETEADYANLPPVRVVDMRQELRAGNTSLFSRALQEALAETLQARQQAILFLNRRGASTFVFCRDCGWVARCARCDAPLTYHTTQERLVCHRCGYARRPLLKCPNCGGGRVRHFGAGTQRVQAEVERLFPHARTLRWDRDATRSKGAHEVILAHFSAHRADVLIGTQMIAKSLDLPLVTLVGVVSADTGLHLPDFRAAERTFQVLTQVSGRAGRSILGGRVILQTYQPDHYAIQAAAAHDYQEFYRQEIRHRKELGYPPFLRLARLVYRHPSPGTAQREADRLARVLRRGFDREQDQASLIGPAPCFFERLRGDYRWQIVIRARDPSRWIPEQLPEGWTIDVDPVSLL